MGNVGIGTAAPTEKLNVHDGNIFVTESTDLTSSLLKYGSMELYRDKTAPVGNVNGYVDFKDAKNDDYDARVYYNSVFGTKGAFSVVLSTDGTPATGRERLTVLNENGNVGISNIAPVTRLDISAPTPGTGIKIADGSEGAGKALVSDANGIGKWETLAGSWAGMLSNNNSTSSAGGNTVPITWNTGTVVGAGGSYDANSITVPTTGFYQVSFAGYLNSNTSPYLIHVKVYVNGVSAWEPHIGAPSAGWGSSISFSNVFNLNAGDKISFLISTFYNGSQILNLGPGGSTVIVRRL